MSLLTRRPQLMLVAVFLLGALLAGSGVVVAATVVKSGKAVTAVKVATETAYQAITSDSTVSSANVWTDVAGMSLTFTVPSSQKALLLITFSALTTCVDGSGGQTFCKVQVLVDGTPALPGPVTFDSAADSNSLNAQETNSMQFVAGPLSAGSHTVKVQGLVDETLATFAINSRTLTVLRSRV